LTDYSRILSEIKNYLVKKVIIIWELTYHFERMPMWQSKQVKLVTTPD